MDDMVAYDNPFCKVEWYHVRGVMLVAKFSGAVHKMHADSASCSSLVAAASLNTRSICKLDVISAMALHSSPALQVQSMKGGIWMTK